MEKKVPAILAVLTIMLVAGSGCAQVCDRQASSTSASQQTVPEHLFWFPDFAEGKRFYVQEGSDLPFWMMELRGEVKQSKHKTYLVCTELKRKGDDGEIQTAVDNLVARWKANPQFPQDSFMVIVWAKEPDSNNGVMVVRAGPELEKLLTNRHFAGLDGPLAPRIQWSDRPYYHICRTVYCLEAVDRPSTERTITFVILAWVMAPTGGVSVLWGTALAYLVLVHWRVVDCTSSIKTHIRRIFLSATIISLICMYLVFSLKCIPAATAMGLVSLIGCGIFTYRTNNALKKAIEEMVSKFCERSTLVQLQNATSSNGIPELVSIHSQLRSATLLLQLGDEGRELLARIKSLTLKLGSLNNDIRQQQALKGDLSHLAGELHKHRAILLDTILPAVNKGVEEYERLIREKQSEANINAGLLTQVRDALKPQLDDPVMSPEEVLASAERCLAETA